jgi:hypothetical protein
MEKGITARYVSWKILRILIEESTPKQVQIQAFLKTEYFSTNNSLKFIWCNNGATTYPN